MSLDSSVEGMLKKDRDAKIQKRCKSIRSGFGTVIRHLFKTDQPSRGAYLHIPKNTERKKSNFWSKKFMKCRHDLFLRFSIESSKINALHDRND